MKLVMEITPDDISRIRYALTELRDRRREQAIEWGNKPIEAEYLDNLCKKIQASVIP